jgi:RND family efflux transporter MFP subunit
MKKLVLAGVGAALLVLLGWRFYSETGGSSGREGFRERRSVAVEVAPVRRLTLRDVGTFTGSTEAEAYFVVAPKVSGRLESLSVDIGDTVRRGQTVAVLDDDEYAQGVEQARAELKVAEATVALARSSLAVAGREHERIQMLRRKGISSESDLDAARSGYEAEEARHEVALAEVARRGAALKATEIRLSYTTIKASWEGGSDERVVGERFVDEGAMLAANSGLVSILDISSLTAVINVIERDYSKIRLRQPVVITTDAFPGREFTGAVARVAPLLKKQSRQARVEITVPNPDYLLRPGMFIRARIEFARHENVQAVPVAAVAKREGREGVFVIEEKSVAEGEEGEGEKEREEVARFVPVKPGIADGGMVEVLEPPLSGPVVTVGHHLLEDGTLVIVSRDEPTQGPPGPNAHPRPPGGAGHHGGGHP